MFVRSGDRSRILCLRNLVRDVKMRRRRWFFLALSGRNLTGRRFGGLRRVRLQRLCAQTGLGRSWFGTRPNIF